MSRVRWHFSLGKFSADALVAGLISAIVTTALYFTFELRRDKQQRTHEYVLLFHSDAHSSYRDVLTNTWMRPDVFAKIGASEEEYASALLSAAHEDPRITVAVFAMVDLLTNVRSCIQTKSCSDGPKIEAFRTFAYGFHQNFFPILRAFDCANENQSTEKLVLYFAPILPRPDYDCAMYAP